MWLLHKTCHIAENDTFLYSLICIPFSLRSLNYLMVQLNEGSYVDEALTYNYTNKIKS